MELITNRPHLRGHHLKIKMSMETTIGGKYTVTTEWNDTFGAYYTTAKAFGNAPLPNFDAKESTAKSTAVDNHNAAVAYCRALIDKI